MSQISPPIRILLVSAVAFMAAWMLFLRPKDDAGTPVAAAPSPAATPRPVEAGGQKSQSLAGKAVEKANEATAAQDAQAEKLAGGAGDDTGTTTAPATSAAPATATAPAAAKTGAAASGVMPSKAELARVPAGVRNAIVKQKVVVLAVVSPKGTDDRLLRKELRKVDKLHGRVFVKSVPVRNVARYTAITRGVDLEQTPTTVVIGYDLKATVLVGWVDSKTIDQSVVDTMRDSGRLFTSPYLRDVDKICRNVPLDVQDSSASTPTEYSQSVGRFASYTGSAKADIARLDAPADLRRFDRATLTSLTGMTATLTTWHAALGKKPSVAKVVGADRYRTRYNRQAKQLRTRMDAHDVIGCGSNR